MSSQTIRHGIFKPLYLDGYEPKVSEPEMSVILLLLHKKTGQMHSCGKYSRSKLNQEFCKCDGFLQRIIWVINVAGLGALFQISLAACQFLA